MQKMCVTNMEFLFISTYCMLPAYLYELCGLCGLHKKEFYKKGERDEKLGGGLALNFNNIFFYSTY